MKPHYLKFDSKEQYIELLGDNEYPAETSVIYPILTELTGETIKDEEGNEYPESARKEGFYVNTLGDYPDCLSDYEVTNIDTPSVKWQGY